MSQPPTEYALVIQRLTAALESYLELQCMFKGDSVGEFEKLRTSAHNLGLLPTPTDKVGE